RSRHRRRAQLAGIPSRTVAESGLEITPREVSSEIWSDSIVGTSEGFDPAAGRSVDYDAQIWGLAGGDIDNPHFQNGLMLGTNLNAWNKSRDDSASCGLLMNRLTAAVVTEEHLDRRNGLYNARAPLMRYNLPHTTPTSPANHC